MKSILIFLHLLFFTTVTYGELGIAPLQSDGLLRWTNSVSNAVYRIDSAPTYGGIYSPIANGSIQASNTHVSVQLQDFGSQPLAFYRVVWTDAPPAQPVGDWEYNGFSAEGVLVVTGLVSITSLEPISGTVVFQNAAPNLHPVGSGAFTNGIILGSNMLQIPLPTGFSRDNFRLAGQMALDEYWGRWSYTDVSIDLSGHSRLVTVSGRFSAKRKQ